MNAETREIVNRIENDMRKLTEVTGESYISSYIINGCFSMNTEAKEDGTYTINVYRKEGEQ